MLIDEAAATPSPMPALASAAALRPCLAPNAARNAPVGRTLAARSAGRGPSGSFNATPTLPLSPTPTRSCCSIVLRKRQAQKTNHRTEQRDRDSAALLGGILFVPDGTKWWSESDRYRYEHKGQARSVSRSMIEAQFGEQVMADLNSPDFAPAILAGTKASLAAETDLAEIRKVAAAAPS
ncbi:hypothetical protein [Lysobacter capsici]|uniref:hypothetical protein n=1 Tax=Lysobacter capsici TaxID=435897 RepID=UPI001BFFE503|nr:hypothetical protein [Lysobacter capsici]QWF19230.1 hypothetical protein KME82_11060 [Lysobacter capsici]